MPTANNTFSAATPITNLIGTPSLSGLLDASDTTDFYKFTLTSSSSTSVTLTELTGNARLRLFDSAQSEITPKTTNNPKQLSEALSLNLPAGTYYIQADLDPSNVSATEAGYKLNLSVSTDAILNNLVWRNKLNGGFSIVQTDGSVVQSSDPIKSGTTSVNLSTDWQGQFGDLNGDGEDDILWHNKKDGTIAYWVMQGSTLLKGELSPYKVSASWQATLADFNNDNRADIFWRNKQTGETAVWLTNSTGLGLSNSALLPSLPSSWDATLGDFNKDGKKDILWRNAQSGEVAVWLMNGTQILTGGAAFLPSLPASWQPSLGDFNKDGRSDILWRNAQSGEVAVWLMNGTQILTGGAAFLPSLSLEWTAQVADFDGNKADDLLWRNSRDGSVAVWLMDGTQIAPSGAAFLPYALPSQFNIERLADFNNDGKADILFRDVSSGQVGIWLLNGTNFLSGAFLPQRSTSDQFDGIQRRQFRSTTRSIGGATELFAFNIGLLNTAGVYADSIGVDTPDYFKFNFGSRSNLVLSANNPAISLQLYKAGVGSTSSTLVPNYATQTLEPGDYYIKVSSNADGINYLLSVEGKPQFTELVGNTFTGPAQVLLTQGDSQNLNPVSTIPINYSIKNAGTFDALNVKVSFYISRDQTFSLSGDRKIEADQSFDLKANQTSPSTSFNLSLPAWTDNFWTVDGLYYIFEVIDPDNTIAETNEDNNVSVLALNVQQIPTTNLRGKSLALNGTFAPAGVVNATFVTENNGFKDATTPFDVSFFLSKTNVFNKDDSTAWAFNPPQSLNSIIGKGDSGTKTASLRLPTKAEWSGWKDLSGQQTFYIGMIQNTDGAVNDVNPDDNQNRGLGIDFVQITVTL